MRVSIDNGQHLIAAEDMTDERIARHWDALVNAMDDDTRERVHAEIAPCTDAKFLARYLELAQHDLVIA